MKQLLCVLFLCMFSYLMAQNSIKNGIQFEKGLNWQQVLDKAKRENKMIFVDCYTTWCAPCKIMDKDVYPSDKIGGFFNEHFISVKVQMDKTGKDDALVKSWYNDAKKIERDFAIDAFPTFLFLSPDGQPLHRAVGGYPEDKFLMLAKDALDSNKQSYTLAKKYNVTKMDTAELGKSALNFYRSNPEFGKTLAAAYFKRLTENEMMELIKVGNSLANFYPADSTVNRIVNGYISRLQENDLFTIQNIEVMQRYSMSSSKDKGFQVFYRYPDRINAVKVQDEFKYDWATGSVDGIIYTEEVKPFVEEAKLNKTVPNWTKISAVVGKKYKPAYVQRAILSGKRNLANANKNNKALTKAITEYMEVYGKDNLNVWLLNSEAWTVFRLSNDTNELSKALSWSNKAITVFPDPAWIDTYANLLYKIGKPKTAILWEEAAIKLDPENADLKKTLEKMKKGEPTWYEQK